MALRPQQVELGRIDATTDGAKLLRKWFSGEAVGDRDHVTHFLTIYLPVINDIHLALHIADDDYVTTVWQADTSFGSDLARPGGRADGLIQELRWPELLHLCK